MFRLRNLSTRLLLPLRKRLFSDTVKVLPFKISRLQSDEIFLKKKGLLEKSSSNTIFKTNSLVIYEKDPVTETYLPFHSADVSNLRSSFSGKYGIDRTELYTYYTWSDGKMVSNTGIRVVTDWYSFSDTLRKVSYNFGIKDLQFYAGFKYPKRYVENALRTEQVISITDLTEDMLYTTQKQRRVVEPHEMNSSYGLEKVISTVYDMEKTRATNYVLKKYSADHVDFTTFNVHTNEANIKPISYHIPAYVYNYKENDKQLHKFINGYTGDYDGQIVYSVWKSLLLGASIGTMLTPLTLIGTPMLTTSLVATRLLIGVASTSLPAGILSKLYPYIKYKHDTKKIEKDKLYNQNTNETEEDKIRRQQAHELNKKLEGFEEYINNLPVDKCRILGLDPGKEMSLVQLKTAYHNEIKKFHPDIYNGDKQVGEDMTKNINEAYKILEKLL